MPKAAETDARLSNLLFLDATGVEWHRKHGMSDRMRGGSKPHAARLMSAPGHSPPIILLYDSRGAADFLGPADRKLVTVELDRLPDVRAVVFHVPSAPDIRGIHKREGQIWVAWSMESDVWYPQLSSVDYMKYFDLTMTYRLYSDIPNPYFGIGTAQALLRKAAPKTEIAPAVFVASNIWDRSGRFDYVRELMRYLPVDSYGKCLNNRTVLEDTGRQTKLDILACYKFTLTFENSIGRDYVTEKFFDALEAGSVPVYLGAPNIDEFGPGQHCFINASKFRNPRALADYLLYLAANESEYESYLAWKEAPLAPAFLEKAARYDEGPFSRLNTILRGRAAGSDIRDLQRDPMHAVVRLVARNPRMMGQKANSVVSPY